MVDSTPKLKNNFIQSAGAIEENCWGRFKFNFNIEKSSERASVSVTNCHVELPDTLLCFFSTG